VIVVQGCVYQHGMITINNQFIGHIKKACYTTYFHNFLLHIYVVILF
jgi:hypothetical protein